MELIKKLPALFNTLMVKAIFDGKTQTRRVIKDLLKQYDRIQIDRTHDLLINYKAWGSSIVYNSKEKPIKVPYQKGGILWVRETTFRDTEVNFIYRADLNNNELKAFKQAGNKWTPSIHMFKKACRLWLRVVNVRVERLQDITEDDAIKEGIKPKKNKILFANFKQIWKDDKLASERAYSYMSRDAFIDIWDSIYEETYYTWRHNPWVWVIEFERI